MTPGIDAAALLKAARAAAGLSQRDLARRAGTAQSVVARIELGETSPTVRTLNRLLEAADASPEMSLRSAGVEGARAASPGARGESRSGKPRSRDQLAERLDGYFRTAATPGVVSAYLFGSTAPRSVPPTHAPHQAGGLGPMTYLVERLAELRRRLDPIREFAEVVRVRIEAEEG